VLYQILRGNSLHFIERDFVAPAILFVVLEEPTMKIWIALLTPFALATTVWAADPVPQNQEESTNRSSFASATIIK
jgi:hypothetical protein